MWKPDVCIYHFPCDDGFGAAWVVRRKWPDVQMVPANYGLALPPFDAAGKNILIVDFSLKPAHLESLAAAANQIIILDHHKTAQEDLSNVHLRAVGAAFDNVERIFARVSGAMANVLAEFDMDKSGASLAWQFCFHGEKPPMLIRHIEDRDLWRMKLEHTRALSLLLRSYPYDFDVWTDLMAAFDDIGGMRGSVLAEAHAIERFYDAKIMEMASTATTKPIGQWRDVPVAHAPYAFASDLAHELLQRHPHAPFAAVIVDAHGGRTFSLRSEDSRQDVSEVARMFGGGGHRNAAGFRVPL